MFINCVGQTIREQFDVTRNYVESGRESLPHIGETYETSPVYRQKYRHLTVSVARRQEPVADERFGSFWPEQQAAPLTVSVCDLEFTSPTQKLVHDAFSEQIVLVQAANGSDFQDVVARN